METKKTGKNKNLKKKKKKGAKKLIICAVALVLVVAILLLALNFCGKDLSKIDILRSENFTVSAAMVTYSLYDTYHYYYNQFGEDMMKLYFGIDPNKSLAEQYSDAEKGVTWFDVFKTEAIDGFTNSLVLCEAAVEAGVELSDIDKKYIQSEIDEIEALATKDGMTLKEYIKKIYGNNVNEDDIRKSLELFRLANKMRYRDFNLATATDEEIQAVVEEEGKTYLQRDFIYFELTLSNDSTKNEKIKEYADRIAATETEADFRAIAEEFVKSEYCVNTEGNKKVLSETVKNNVPDEEKNELDSWSFANGTVVGSTYTETENTRYMVYMAVSEPALDETSTRNMYTIVFEPSVYGSLEECKAKAEEVYAMWESGTRDIVLFKELAQKYSTDYVSVFAGGEYANIKKGDMIDELDAWLFTETLAVGASAIMGSEYGYHIVLYSGEGVPAWKAPVIDGIKEDKVSSVILGYVEQHDVETVNGNMKYVKAK